MSNSTKVNTLSILNIYLFKTEGVLQWKAWGGKVMTRPMATDVFAVCLVLWTRHLYSDQDVHNGDGNGSVFLASASLQRWGADCWLSMFRSKSFGLLSRLRGVVGCC